MEGLERWKARHPDVWPLLEPADVLVDSMRGRSSTWTRIRLNLEHVPEDAASAAGAARGRLRPVGRIPAAGKWGVTIRHAPVTFAVTRGDIVLAC